MLAHNTDDAALLRLVGHGAICKANVDLCDISRTGIDTTHNTLGLLSVLNCRSQAGEKSYLVVTFEEDRDQTKGLNHQVERSRRQPLPEGSKPHSDRRRCVALYSGVWGNDSGYIEAMHLAELCANQEIMVPDEYPNSPLHLCDYPISRSIFHWSRSLWLTTEHLPGLGIIMSSDMPRYLPHKVLMAIGIVGRSYEPSTALRSTMATTS